jgi:hypothetical protein
MFETVILRDPKGQKNLHDRRTLVSLVGRLIVHLQQLQDPLRQNQSLSEKKLFTKPNIVGCVVRGTYYRNEVEFLRTA